jgi:hypothetical protein
MMRSLHFYLEPFAIPWWPGCLCTVPPSFPTFNSVLAVTTEGDFTIGSVQRPTTLFGGYHQAESENQCSPVSPTSVWGPGGGTVNSEICCFCQARGVYTEPDGTVRFHNRCITLLCILIVSVCLVHATMVLKHLQNRTVLYHLHKWSFDEKQVHGHAFAANGLFCFANMDHSLPSTVPCCINMQDSMFGSAF